MMPRTLLSILAAWACVLTLSSAAPRIHATQTRSEYRLSDNSDWWSFSKSVPSMESLKPQDRLVSLEGLTIAGIAVYGPWTGKLDSIFGKPAWASRGEASGQRDQACYVSAGEDAPIYLIFESGIESDSSIYLFRGGSAWTGIDLCVRSTAVTSSLSTVSGIHLGQDVNGVIAILGNPNRRTSTELFYVLDQHTKLSDAELQAMRKDNPRMPEDDFKKWTAAHPAIEHMEFLVARFDVHGLNYFGATVALGE